MAAPLLIHEEEGDGAEVEREEECSGTVQRVKDLRF